MLFSIVSRGKHSGIRLLPHRFQDNRFHVCLGKGGPHIPISDDREIPSYLANGYSLKMSNPEMRTPVLVSPQSIRGWSPDSKEIFYPIFRENVFPVL